MVRYSKTELLLEALNLPFKCQECKNKPKTLHIHHIKPLAIGGENKLYNIMFVCPKCHRKLDSKIYKKYVNEYDLRLNPNKPQEQMIMIRGITEKYRLFMKIRRLNLALLGSTKLRRDYFG